MESLKALGGSARRIGGRIADRVVSTLEHGTPLFGASPPAPPGLEGSVLFGNAEDGFDAPLELFMRCTTELGDISRLRFGRHFYYLVNDPEMIQRVLVDNQRNYKKSRYHLGMEMIMGRGLVTSDGDLWRRQRRLAQPAFHREHIAAFARTMSDCTRDTLARLGERQGQPVQIDDELRRLTLQIVCRTLFSTEAAGDLDEIGRAALFASDFANSFFHLPTWIPTAKNRELARVLGIFEDLVHRVIAERRADRARGRSPGDVISMLMSATDETGAGMSDKQLRDEAVTLLLAGFETTSNALAWTLYLLSLHPDVERRLRAHVVGAIDRRDPTAEDVHDRLGYVTQVLNESMRLYPPAWIIEREALGEDRLGGYVIPAGATVAACPWALHRRPDIWANPEGFDPDRFAPGRVRARCTFLPFGDGPRICIGNTFAMMAGAVALSMIVRDYRLDLVPGHKVEPDPETSLRTRYGIRMVPSPMD